MSCTNLHKPLNIYRASAGSGKTHLLTGFYIKLLFLPQLLPETHSGELRFSEILAVTFTNKATAEMKGRIIAELYQLSQEPRKSDYWDEVSLQGSRSESAISKKATDLLVQILNDYSSFNISTIDSFFQRIVRSFARELNVPGNYEVELDSNSAIEAAVNSFLDKLNPKQSLFEWMVKFTDKRSEEGEGWDIRQKLIEMAKTVLSSESYRQHSEQIKAFTSDRKQLMDYEQMLRGIVKNWRENLSRIGKVGLGLIKDYEIEPSELSYGGSGTVSHFQAWAKSEETDTSKARFVAVMDNPDKLFKKGSSRYGSELQLRIVALMEEGAALMNGKVYTDYMTASVILQDLYELGIIANIDEELHEYCNDQNIMLLNSTTELLSKLIEPYDAPFIYEKTGTHLKSYMIDEFQDTSSMQWRNFTPLISNTLSQGYQNLIVGDVKQSIYRWRGSDWGLLDSEIAHYEADLHNDNDDALRTNWRSLPAIVDFNNQFFTQAASELDEMTGIEQIGRIYKDVKQELPPKRTALGKPKGLVRLEPIIPLDEEGEPLPKANKSDLYRTVQERLPQLIIELQQQGFRPGDIAILCRWQRECRLMAEALLKYKQEHPDCPYPMDIISGQALQLGTRPVIQALINMMQLLQKPDSELQQAIAWNSFLQLSGLTPEESIHTYFRMPKEQRCQLLPPITFRPLYELTELLIAKLPPKVITEEAPFLQSFRDVVLEYSHSQNADLSAFLTWWEQTGSQKPIATPEAMNAIQIMTIHKSKGLGMPAVIIPFASWNMDIVNNAMHRDIIWCEPKEEPFARNILLPIQRSEKLMNTIFQQDYVEERLRTIIDNLNTAYVAFTRAKETMIIMAPVPSDNDHSSLEYLLWKHCADQYGTHQEVTTLGQWDYSERKSEGGPDTAISLPPTDTPNSLPQLSILHSPLQHDDVARRRGNAIHRVLQDICHADDSQQVISTLYQRGVIDPALISKEEMLDEIQCLLQIPQVASWFSPSVQVLNEQTLINAAGEAIRPDRILLTPEGEAIIIDYKTGDDHAGYRSQVKDYMKTLCQAGFRHVRGYLLFLKDGKIVEVNAFDELHLEKVQKHTSGL